MGTDTNERNRRIIEEFRANDGVVGGMFEDATVLLLHTTGRRSGEERVNPLMTLNEDGRIFVFATYGGADHHPDWYHNLVAHPDIVIEKGTETIPVRAVELVGEARDTIFARHSARFPIFTEYQHKLERTIPVIRLEPRTGD